MPTLPLPSPTTASAANEKRRPPFTTLAQRLMKTTFSIIVGPSPSCGFSRLSRRGPRIPPGPRMPPPRKPPWPRGERCSRRSGAGVGAGVGAETGVEAGAPAATAAGAGAATSGVAGVVFSGAEVGSVLMQFLELEATFARGVGECFDFAVIGRAAAVEHDHRDAGRLGLRGERRAERLRAGEIRLQLLL